MLCNVPWLCGCATVFRCILRNIFAILACVAKMQTEHRASAVKTARLSAEPSLEVVVRAV